MKRVHIEYEDGQYWLSQRGGKWNEVQIPLWRWWWYSLVTWLAIKQSRWIAKLDNDREEV